MKKVLRVISQFIKAVLSLIKHVTIIGMLIVGGISVYLIYTAYQVTVSQYNESLTWENTAYDAPLAEVEPVLVSNVVDTDKVAAADAWNALEDYLKHLDVENMDKEKASKIVERAAHWQKIYNLDSDNITRLSLYLQIEKEIPKAYSTLNTEKLDKLTGKLYNLELEHNTKAGQQYMKRIVQVSEDFAKAKRTMTDTVLSVGTLKNGVWTIPYTYERADLASVLEQIQALYKFPALCNTANVLSDAATALNYNKNARDYFAYRKFVENMETVTRSDYIAVSSIYTYGQALENGLIVDVEEQPGFLISEDSVVTGIYSGGTRLENDMYIKRSADVVVYIDPVYEPDPEAEDSEEDEPEEQLPEDAMEPDISQEPEEMQNDEQMPEEEAEPQIDNTPPAEAN